MSGIGGGGAGGGIEIASFTKRTGAQTIPNSTSTAVSLDLEQYDTNGMHSDVTNPSRITFKTAGRYLVYGKVGWQASAVGGRQTWARLNGATTIAGSLIDTGFGDATLGPENSFCFAATFAVDDYVEMMVWQNSGAGLGLTADDMCMGAIKIDKSG